MSEDMTAQAAEGEQAQNEKRADDGAPVVSENEVVVDPTQTLTVSFGGTYSNTEAITVFSLSTIYDTNGASSTVSYSGVLQPTTAGGAFSAIPPGAPQSQAPPPSEATRSPGPSSVTSRSGDFDLSTATSSRSPSSTSRPSQAANQGDIGLSPGAVTGIAIGGVALGILLGTVIACILFRRKREQKPRAEHVVPVQYRPEGKFLPKDKGLLNVPVNYDLQLDQFILDSRPDAEITTELRALGQLVQQHVENHYHFQPVQGNPNALASILASLGLEDQQPITLVDLASLALDHRTRSPALQHIISRVAFESTVLGGSTPISLLPTFTKELVDNLPPVESHRGNREGELELPDRLPENILTQ